MVYCGEVTSAGMAGQLKRDPLFDIRAVWHGSDPAGPDGGN